jgi:hypothetical protein
MSTAGTASRPGVVTWAGLTVVASSAAVLSFATVRDLAQSSGYPPRLAWLLPVVIDAAAVVGSRIWLGGGAAPGAIRYARALALAAAVVTIGANVLQHGLAAYHQVPPWWLVAALAAIPPTALVAVAHQVALLTRPRPVTESVAGEHPGDTHTRRETDAIAAGPTGCEQAAARPVGDDELADRVRQVVTTSERPIGRRRLARELAITEHQARQLLSQVTDPAGEHPGGPPTPPPAPTLAFPGMGELSRRNGAVHHV